MKSISLTELQITHLFLFLFYHIIESNGIRLPDKNFSVFDTILQFIGNIPDIPTFIENETGYNPDVESS